MSLTLDNPTTLPAAFAASSAENNAMLFMRVSFNALARRFPKSRIYLALVTSRPLADMEAEGHFYATIDGGTGVSAETFGEVLSKLETAQGPAGKIREAEELEAKAKALREEAEAGK